MFEAATKIYQSDRRTQVKAIPNVLPQRFCKFKLRVKNLSLTPLKSLGNFHFECQIQYILKNCRKLIPH